MPKGNLQGYLDIINMNVFGANPGSYKLPRADFTMIFIRRDSQLERFIKICRNSVFSG